MNKLSHSKNYVLLFLFLFGFIVVGKAQKKYHALPLRMHFMIPKALANQGYSKTFKGVFDFGLAFGYGYRNFNVGGFFRTMQFEIPGQFAVRIKMLQAIQNTGIRLGYDYPFSKDKFIFTSGIAVGHNWIQYSRIETKLPVNRNATGINISPSIGVNYLVENGFGFGVEVAYNNINYVFDPYAVRLNESISYKPEELKGKTGMFAFGFSVYYNFLVKSDDNDDF